MSSLGTGSQHLAMSTIGSWLQSKQQQAADLSDLALGAVADVTFSSLSPNCPPVSMSNGGAQVT